MLFQDQPSSAIRFKPLRVTLHPQTPNLTKANAMQVKKAKINLEQEKELLDEIIHA